MGIKREIMSRELYGGKTNEQLQLSNLKELLEEPSI